MKLHRAVIAIAAAAVTAVGGAGCGAVPGPNQAPGSVTSTAPSTSPPSTSPSTSSPSAAPPSASSPSTSSPTTSSPSTSSPTTPPSTSSPADDLSGENLIRERLYYDVTGHSFTRVKPGSGQVLSPCTGDRTFADSLPEQGVTSLSTMLVGEEGRKVVHQVAQTGSPDEARAAGEEIVTLVAQCPGISGGDFGYGDPVTVVSNGKREIVYLPAFDSDRPAGGYIVVRVGNRVGVVDVADSLPEKKVAHLARETAGSMAM